MGSTPRNGDLNFLAQLLQFFPTKRTKTLPPDLKISSKCVFGQLPVLLDPLVGLRGEEGKVWREKETKREEGWERREKERRRREKREGKKPQTKSSATSLASSKHFCFQNYSLYIHRIRYIFSDVQQIYVSSVMVYFAL